ncbi:MAG: ASCH domain-containing protein [Patescibacteria group bacterium]
MASHKLIFRDCDQETFNLIKNGQKKIETRAGLPEYFEIKARDLVNFICGDYACEKEIKNVSVFPSLNDLFKVYEPEQIDSSISTIEEMTAKYMSFPGYPERIEKSGIIVFELK